MEKQISLLDAEVTKHRKSQLNALEAAQLVEAINSGKNVKVTGCPPSKNKGYSDTPLFGAAPTPDLFSK